jgi:hypothetical protein
MAFLLQSLVALLSSVLAMGSSSTSDAEASRLTLNDGPEGREADTGSQAGTPVLVAADAAAADEAAICEEAQDPEYAEAVAPDAAAPAPDTGSEADPGVQTGGAIAFDIGAQAFGGTGDDNGPVTEGGEGIEVMAGRVTTLALDQDADVTSIRIVGMPEHGNVTVNPDNTFALVLTGSDHTGPLSFSYEVTHADGSVTTHETSLEVVPGVQGGGWGDGEGYMLETDADDNVVVEHGANHREVYVSNGDDALSLADIANLEGLPVEKISSTWLIEHPEYGSSEVMALKPDAGLRLWKGMTGNGSEPGSHWLLFESGHTYEDLPNILDSGTAGESALHPIYIGAYGEGDRPVLDSQITLNGQGNAHIVVQGIEIAEGINVLTATNVLFDDVVVSDEEMNIQNIDGFTIRNSSFIDVIDDEAAGSTWAPNGDRTSGLYLANSRDILIEGNFADHSGWADGYDYNLSADDGQAPSMYSHNFYLQSDNLGVTFRDNISMRAAGTGAQIRSGGFIEDNIFIDNNGALFLGAGSLTNSSGGTDGNYSLVLGNVVTSGAHKTAADGVAALTSGITAGTHLASLVDNIVAHLADPNNPTELTWKEITHDSVDFDNGTYVNDTIVHNWMGSKEGSYDNKIVEANTELLDKVVLNQTTIQLFAGELLGKSTATIADLADYLRAQAGGAFDTWVDADVINDFFQAGFGLDTDIRDTETTLRFIPDARGDGIRWDNRLNWSTGDLPGTQDGDSVDLHGNWVNYGGTTRLDDLDLGEGGKLTVGQGYLEVEDELAVGAGGADIDIDGAGQFWTDGYADRHKLDIDVEGGRFANTGVFKGKVDMTVADNGQAILATDGASFDLSAGSTLEIIGNDTRVGFDGDGRGLATLRLDDESTLRFVADEGLGRIREFQSGHYADGRPGNNLYSGADLGDARLEIDITELACSKVTERVLMRVDELVGKFEELDVIGLDGNRDATVVIDYQTDTVVLRLSAAGRGTGLTEIKTVNDDMEAPDGKVASDLWDALTADHGVLADDPITSDEDDEVAPVL